MRLFVSVQNLARFFARQGLIPDVNLANEFAYAKHTVPKPARHGVQQSAGQLKGVINMPKCMYCGAEIDADASFCDACGKSTSKTKECVRCSEQIPVNAKFCKHCGFDQNKDPWDWT